QFKFHLCGRAKDSLKLVWAKIVGAEEKFRLLRSRPPGRESTFRRASDRCRGFRQPISSQLALATIMVEAAWVESVSDQRRALYRAAAVLSVKARAGARAL